MNPARRDQIHSQRAIVAAPPLVIGFTLALVAAVALAFIVSVMFWIAAALLVGAALLYLAFQFRRSR